MPHFADSPEITPEFTDETDLLLIRTLQDHPRASYSTIARLTGISNTTVRRRIRALFDSGRVSMVVLPGLRALGYTYSALVMIKTEAGLAETVGRQLKSIGEVTYLSMTLGGHSTVCIVRAKSLTALGNLIEGRIAAIHGVIEVESSVVTSVLKGWGQWRVPMHVDDISPELEHALEHEE